MTEYFRKEVPASFPEYTIQNKTGVTRTKRPGTVVRELAVATYDFATLGGAVGAIGLGVYLPSKAIITKVWVDVVTTLTSPTTDAATIALHVQAANDIVSAIAISDASNVWDAGIHGSKIGFPAFANDAAEDTALEVAALFAATYLKLTAVREITATVAVEDLTAGKFNVFVEYVISD